MRTILQCGMFILNMLKNMVNLYKCNLCDHKGQVSLPFVISITITHDFFIVFLFQASNYPFHPSYTSSTDQDSDPNFLKRKYDLFFL